MIPSLRQTRNRTNTSYKDKNNFFNKVDALPQGPQWTCTPFTVTGDVLDYNGELKQEELDLWTRDPVECVRELIGNPLFAESMAYAPEQVFSGSDKEERIFNEMWTADWWWRVQVSWVTSA